MDRKSAFAIIILSLVVIISLILVMGFSINTVEEKMENYCFEQLERTADRLSSLLHTSVNNKNSILLSMSNAISDLPQINRENLINVLNSYISISPYISAFEFLNEEGLLNNKGILVDPVGFIDFEEEKRKDSYTSSRVRCPYDPNVYEIRSSYPVVKEGLVIGVLYGVTLLSELPDLISTEIFNYQTYVYLVDGNNGDFLLDTWHNTLGNITEMGDRETFGDNTLPDAIEDMKTGEAGRLVFTSRTTGEKLFFHYKPVGINNLVIILAVSEEVGMREVRAINQSLYLAMAISIGLLSVFLIILFIIFASIFRRTKKFSLQDQVTGIQNRAAFELLEKNSLGRKFEKLICAYIDINCLHEINNTKGHESGDKVINALARSLKGSFDYKEIFRVGGDEFIILSEVVDEKLMENYLLLADQQTRAAEGFGISFAIVSSTQEVGIFDITKKTDQLMLEKKREFHRQID